MKLCLACALFGVLQAGCFLSASSLPPREALLRAHADINARLNEVSPAPTPPRALGTAAEVRVWHMAHAAGRVLVEEEGLAGFHARHPGLQLQSTFIGEWTYAVQKLTVALVADDLPDIVLVPRDWAAMLATAGQLLPVDTLLGPGQLEGIPPSMREACTHEGTLFALPAGVTCSVLLCNSALVSTPPVTWEDLRATASVLRNSHPESTFYPIGHYPYLESLWSAGGNLCDSRGSMLDRPEALTTLEWLLALRDDGLLHPNALLRSETGLSLFLQGRCAMTVVDSDAVPQRPSFPFAVVPVPGMKGSISRMDAVVWAVIPRRDGAAREALAAVLTWLMETADPLPEAVAGVLPHAQAPVLMPEWAQAESILFTALDRAARYQAGASK